MENNIKRFEIDSKEYDDNYNIGYSIQFILFDLVLINMVWYYKE